jgi:hypothetical protein
MDWILDELLILPSFSQLLPFSPFSPAFTAPPQGSTTIARKEEEGKSWMDLKEGRRGGGVSIASMSGIWGGIDWMKSNNLTLDNEKKMNNEHNWRGNFFLHIYKICI